MQVYEVVLDEFTKDVDTGKRRDEPEQLGATMVLAADADKAVAKAKKSRIGRVYRSDDDELEPWNIQVVEAKLVSIIEVCTIDVV